MPFRVMMSARAELEIEQGHGWWAANRSGLQADRWYKRFKLSILDLADNPRRHPLSRENGLFPFEIRDLYFGLGSRPTHRAVFTIVGDEVRVLTIRHAAQADLRENDVS